MTLGEGAAAASATLNSGAGDQHAVQGSNYEPRTVAGKTFLPWVYRLAWISLLVALLLPITLGGVVTSMDVGMAVNDWPTTNHENMFTASIPELAENGGVGAVVEHSHRLAGALIGLVVTALAIATLFQTGSTLTQSLLATAIFILVCVQGYVGGMRVLENERSIAIFHAVGAQVILVALMALIKISSPAWIQKPRIEVGEAGSRLRLWSLMGLSLLFVHLWAGAGLRHQQASLSAHLILAIGVTGVLLALIYFCFVPFAKHPALWKAGKILMGLIGVQLALGLASWAFKHGPENLRTGIAIHAPIATLHMITGAIIMVTVTTIAMEAWFRLQPNEAPEGGLS